MIYNIDKPAEEERSENSEENMIKTKQWYKYRARAINQAKWKNRQGSNSLWKGLVRKGFLKEAKHELGFLLFTFPFTKVTHTQCRKLSNYWNM